MTQGAKGLSSADVTEQQRGKAGEPRLHGLVVTTSDSVLRGCRAPAPRGGAHPAL